ncbi:hypothetical protein [Caldisalinibacter kiritimatiensis]|uniref:Type 4 fimbrial biogenesis protein PilX N-terminal domain-containing protein n=1 Tax=Caldisalinibacter kiritimatiensis TaxID=1304284 RepID=R1AXZ9_9FIRM|nr:hypothetical protein [Caldisalinibacter kiritimatiensis]EOD01522.1 hypothetical protein L21TH_0405 [Caldisalinibacter kiritimatiensis]
MIIKYFRNNKGSTVLMVLVVMMILSILGTTILSMAVSNYKMVFINSNVKKNLYLSEAGLEEIYAILGDFVNQAIEQGNKAADEFIDYVNNLKPEDDDYDTYFNEDGTLKINVAEEQLNISFKEGYIDKDGYKDEILSLLKGSNGLINDNGTLNINDYPLRIDDGYGNKPEITFYTKKDSYSKDKLVFNDGKVTIGIRSTYTKDNVVKTISVTYKILVPEYNAEVYEEIKVVKETLDGSWDKAISADGDIKFKGDKISLNGDVFIEGDDKGISIEEDNTELTINGNISTNMNLLVLSEGNNIEVQGDFFGQNIYLENEAGVKSNNITFGSIDELSGDVYLKDDIEINGKNNKITFNGGFYGISDSSEVSGPDESSSIIINEKEGTELTFNKDLIIYGSSFIDLINEKYQTGESISIKGNYIAYTKKILDNDKRDFKGSNIIFEYKEPLILASKIKDGQVEKDLTLEDKSKYIKYYNEDTNGNSLNVDGVNIRGIDENNKYNEDYNIIHSGAVISTSNPSKGNRVIAGNYKPMDELLIRDKKEIYNQNIKGLTANQLISSEDDYSKINNVNSEIYEGDELIYYDENNNNLAIIGPNISKDTYPDEITDNVAEERIASLTNPAVNGVIITNGDVFLIGDIEYSGIIFANNIVILDDGIENTEITISNDKNFVETIFRQCGLLGSISETTEELGPRGDGAIVKKDNLIKMSSWSIER